MKKLLCYMAFLIFGMQAQAQIATPRIQKNQIKQHQRIHNGVRNGSLTPRETRGLKRQQRNIQLTKKRAKRDGRVSCRERKNIRRKQANAHRNIYRQKHD